VKDTFMAALSSGGLFAGFSSTQAFFFQLLHNAGGSGVADAEAALQKRRRDVFVLLGELSGGSHHGVLTAFFRRGQLAHVLEFDRLQADAGCPKNTLYAPSQRRR
jgi:hypothetical protein